MSQSTATFEYRPAADGAPDRATASLALSRAAPDRVDVVMPCHPGSRFFTASVDDRVSNGRKTWSPLPYEEVVGTALVSVGDEEATVKVDGAVVLTARHASSGGCTVAAGYLDGQWSLRTDVEDRSATGPAPRIGELSFVGGAAIHPISVTTVATREIGSSPGVLQATLLGVAVVALGAAFVVGWQGAQPAGGSPQRVSFRTVDGVVIVGLAGMAVLIPAFFDDGWLWAIQRDYPTHGDLSGVFENAAASPLGYWLGWVQQWWLRIASSAIAIRLPLLVVGGLTWWMLRSLAGRANPSAFTQWVMASVFLVGFGSWGMTWRPEPVVAALLVASALLAVRFDEGDHDRAPWLWAVVVALGATAHPAGLVVAAPAIVSWRGIASWSKAGPARTVAVMSILVGLVVLLAFADGNLATKLEAIDAARAGEHERSVFDEVARYRTLSGENGTVLRRLSLVSIVGAGLVFLVARLGGASRTPLSLVGRSLLVAAGLLALTPSKWEWHFGVLLGLVAVVFALATESLDASDSRRMGAVGAVTLVAAAAVPWSWATDTQWAPLDLRTQQWWVGATNLLPVDLSSVLVWLVLIGGVWLIWFARRRPRSWTPSAMVMLMAAVLALGVTGGTLALDTARTDRWTFGSQNVQGLWGGAGCGLGDEIAVPAEGSLHELEVVDVVSPDADAAASAAGFIDTGSFVVGGIHADGFNTTPPVVSGWPFVGSWVAMGDADPDELRGGHRGEWHEIEDGDAFVAVMFAGSFEPRPETGEPDERWTKNAIGVQFGRAEGSGVVSHGIESPDLDAYFVDWSLALFERPPDADLVRVLLVDESSGGEGAWVAGSPPMGAAAASLPTTGVMITPPLIPYFPCVDTPTSPFGVVAVPDIVMIRNDFWHTPFVFATAVDRYFDLRVVIPPDRERDRILIAVSQEYLTGSPARVTGIATQIGFE